MVAQGRVCRDRVRVTGQAPRMPSLFSKLAQAAADAGNVVARTAANAHEVLTDKDLRKCAVRATPAA